MGPKQNWLWKLLKYFTSQFIHGGNQNPPGTDCRRYRWTLTYGYTDGRLKIKRLVEMERGFKKGDERRKEKDSGVNDSCAPKKLDLV